MGFKVKRKLSLIRELFARCRAENAILNKQRLSELLGVTLLPLSKGTLVVTVTTWLLSSVKLRE